MLLELCFHTANAVVITNFPVADTGIQKANPTINFGSSPDLVSGGLGLNSGFDVRRILLKFDFSGQIPPQAIINSVAVTVNVIDHLPGGGAGPASTFDLRRVLQDWNEPEATWNNRSSINAWNSPGAAGAGDSVSIASSTVFISGLGSYVFPSTATLVADVRDYVANPGSNFGWLLISESEAPQTARHFASREDPVNTPYIVVDFSLPAPSPVISGAALIGGSFHFSFNA
ncbi:MAG TPA: DNRLRE domain-containing protein, partial [Verrucomicrobiae bacterium]|nr:DNRLRE domain-containing protein [Verrucomicrobiae bacterium]